MQQKPNVDLKTSFMASQLSYEERNEKELLQLVQLHDSLEPGLPSIPSYLDSIARNELRLKMIRETHSSQTQQGLYEIHKAQAALFESLITAMNETEKSHEANVNELNESLEIQKMLHKIIYQQ